MRARATGWLAAATALGVVVAGSGCIGPPPPPRQAPTPLRAAAPLDTVPGSVPDASIVRVLLGELRADPVVSRENLSVDSVLGVVTLWGNVSNRLAKERAVELAHVVRGVRAVVDRLTIPSKPRPDGELEFAVAGRLSQDPVTAGQRIGAQVREGTVTLTGDVDSNATRRIAESEVLSIPGVRDVVDDLAVRPATRRTDEQLEREVDRIVRSDPWLDGSHVQVEAADGSVRLRGYVGSDAERARAEEDARAASPRDVDATGLRVEGFIDQGTLRARPPAPRPDDEIGQSLLDAYVRDPRVAPFVPNVDVHDGVVVLTGVAPNPIAARAAGEDARNVPGVQDVRDDIKSAPTVLSAGDERVRAEIESAIAHDPRLASMDIQVDVTRGRVFLRGTVPTETDRLHAIALASSAAGARDVQDGLVLVPVLGVTNAQGR